MAAFAFVGALALGIASFLWFVNGRRVPPRRENPMAWGYFWGCIGGAIFLLILWLLILAGILTEP